MHKTFNDDIPCSVDYEAEAARLSDMLMKSEAEARHWKMIASEHEEELRKLRIIIKTIETMTGRTFDI